MSAMDGSPLSICLFGAPLDTGNLGVSALGLSTLAEIARRIPGAEVTLFDHGRGTRPLDLRIDDVHVRGVRRGAWISRRLHRGESLWSMLAAARFGPRLNANVRAIDAASVVLDISGGDSFSDLYGRKQLDLVTLPKRIALLRGRPLVLLPQTYGPFHTADSAAAARRILLAADQVWSRDLASFDRLRDLLGDGFDPQRHRSGADVAFALPATDPGPRLGDLARRLVDEGPVVGLNLSGLLAADPADAGRRFDLRCDYGAAMEQLVRRLLAETEHRILLIPHVRGSGPGSDDGATARLLEAWAGDDRVACLPSGLGADEIKHVIGRLEWFIGARMHATIAALSSRVPVAAVAYSDKFQGIFDACGVGHRVLDARRLSTTDLVDSAFEAWQGRGRDAAVLRSRVCEVEATVRHQFDEIVPMLGRRADPGRQGAG